MTNILFLLPHASTGGMPQFALKRIELLKGYVKKSNYNITVVEYQCVSDIYTVQRNKIKAIANEFITLGENKMELIDIIKNRSIEIIHIENEAEGFDYDLMDALYSDDRNYRIVETCHNVTFNPKNKVFYPDAFAYCSPYHEITFKELNVYSKIIEYPINAVSYKEEERFNAIEKLGFNLNRINVLNVGLWTENKNQKEGIEIAKAYPNIDFHFVGNQAENFKEYWQPLMDNLPDNVKIWGEREDISDFMLASDLFMFNSLKECNPLVLKEAISYKLPIYAHNLPQYCGEYDKYISENFSDVVFIANSVRQGEEFKVYSAPKQNSNFLAELITFYNQVLNNQVVKQPKSSYSFISHFVDGAYFEIVGKSKSNFRVQFSDYEDNVIYENTIKCNEWVKLNRQYYTKYRIKVWENETLVYDEILSLENKKVMICFDSSSLGDTLAWMPYCDLFQKQHKCELVVSTFKNFLFEGKYPNIKFIEPASVENNLYAKYNLGWYYDSNKEPVLPNIIPLQQTATNILGLPFMELKPKLNFKSKGFEIEGVIYNNHICIATNSTSGCKEWPKENWQQVVDYLKEEGFTVINISKENNYDLKGLTKINDYSLENIMQIISTCEYMIGLSSGLSWLAWSLDKHVVMISNFSKKDHEFISDCTRIDNEDVCHGCWNNKNFKFSKSNWNWCPINEGYHNQFECQRSITALRVINTLVHNEIK